MGLGSWLIEGIRNRGFRHISDRDGDRLVYRWLDHWGWLVIPVVILVMNVFSVVVLLSVAQGVGHVAWIVFAGDVPVAYFLLRRFVNSTTVALLGHEVIVGWGPVPWQKTVRLSRDELVAVRIRERRVGNSGTSGSGSQTAHDVYIERTAGKPLWLVKWVSSFGAAVRAKDSVSQYLGLEDPSPAGEGAGT